MPNCLAGMLPIASSFIKVCLFVSILNVAVNSKLRKPNILVLITDDQDVQLGSLQFMPKTLRLLRQRGADFVNAFVSTPICCPSRSTIFSGMYAHNHNVVTNNQNCSGENWRNSHEKATFAVPILEAGYRTGFFGKYLNEYDGSWVPPGWSKWLGLVRNSRYYNYSLNDNGQLRWHGFDYANDYLTDLVANESIRFLQQTVVEWPKNPFLAVVSFPAPHGPEDPAPQFSELFEGIETHRTESWNFAPNPDKQWLLQRTGKMEPIHVAFTDLMQRRRLQTLQSVDEAVEKLVQTLRALNQLHNTYLLFTSDHGYHLGQFGLLKGKAMPFEFDIRVPFLLRGPGIPWGKTIHSIVANIDISPTILAMARLNIPSSMDGRSILEVPELMAANDTQQQQTWRHTLLIERGKMPKLRRLRDRLREQRERWDKEGRLERECAKLKYRRGCQMPGQRWQCLNNSGRWRIQKCRENWKECNCDGEGKGRTKRETQLSGKSIEEGDNLYGDEDIEFLLELEESEMLTSGQWFQGLFRDDQQNFPSNRTRREIRPFLQGNSNYYNVADSSSIACSRLGDSDCRQLVNSSTSAEIQIEQKQLKHRINALRHKLSVFKNLRKALNRPLKRTESTDNNADCECAKRRRHPLRRKGFHGWSSSRPNSNSTNESSPSSNCHIAQMNCFHHSAQHWRTPPLWPAHFGHFCFCQNANNNSYWCLRTLNGTHNFLFCEFVTEELAFFNLDKDPHQLVNSVHELPEEVLEQLSSQLQLLKSCRGKAQCEHFASSNGIH